MKSRKSQDDPQANCLPFGVPRGAPYPWRIVRAPADGAATHMFILYEGNIHSYRQIFMTGKHPDDPDPTWYGHSVGHWEKDTLVVDTVGFNDKTWLDAEGHPHSDELHLVERIRRVNHDTMSIDFTIDDPKAYTKPWVSHAIFELKPGWNIGEVVCVDDNANFADTEKMLESNN